jgi:hypothetical protein
MSEHSFIRDTAVKLAVKMGIYSKIVALLNRQIAKREAASIRKHGVEVLAKVDEVLTKHGIKPFLTFGCFWVPTATKALSLTTMTLI